MDLLITVLLLLFCLLISNIISHYVPFIPTSLTQIAFGIILALIFKDISFELEAEWFLLLFVAPLLYNDGRYFPRKELWKMRAPIFGNAIILVLLTTIIGGYFIHWLIPDIPLAAAFALAAILSPTDPVAVNGIAQRIRLPEKVLNLVRGESLINDASGLVAFNYAVTAVVTGYFSLREAIFDFTYMFLAGAVLGLVLAIVVIAIRFILHKQGINDITFHSLLQIMTPFFLFFIVEELLHASGVIAVVVAGIVHSLMNKRTEIINAEEQVLTENIWSIILFVLNGIVFLLLGLNIPSSMVETVENPNVGNWLVIGYVVAIGVAVLGIRFAWAHSFSYYQYHFGKTDNAITPNVKTSLLISLTGVRGAVTMVGVLSIPFLITGGEAFPQRSLILFLAAGVILFTLVVATVFLPILSKGKSVEGDTSNQVDLVEAKRKILLLAIKKIKTEINKLNFTAAYELMDEYKIMLNRLQSQYDSPAENTSDAQQKIRDIRLMALKAERQYIYDLMDKGKIDESVFETFEKFLDHREEALSNNIRSVIMYLISKSKRAWKRFRCQSRKDKEIRLTKLREGKDIQLRALESALQRLENYASRSEKGEMANNVILDYKRMIQRLETPAARYSAKTEEQKEELRIKVMDIERSEIHRMYEAGEINREQARELRRFINYVESVTLYEHSD